MTRRQGRKRTRKVIFQKSKLFNSLGFGLLALFCGCMIVVDDPTSGFTLFLIGAVLIAWYFVRKRRVENKPKEKPIANDKPKDHIDINCYIPSRIGDCLRLYQYFNLRIRPIENACELVQIMQAENTWTFEIKVDNNVVQLYFKENLFGELIDKADMVIDWLKRNDPCIVGLKRIDIEKNEYVAFAAFYRDEQKRLAYRENEIVKLIKFANKDVQENLEYINEGDMCELSEDFDDENNDIIIVEVGDKIGQLPKKQAEKFRSNGCAGAFIDHVDFDDEKEKYIPYVKIYW